MYGRILPAAIALRPRSAPQTKLPVGRSWCVFPSRAEAAQSRRSRSSRTIHRHSLAKEQTLSPPPPAYRRGSSIMDTSIHPRRPAVKRRIRTAAVGAGCRNARERSEPNRHAPGQAGRFVAEARRAHPRAPKARPCPPPRVAPWGRKQPIDVRRADGPPAGYRSGFTPQHAFEIACRFPGREPVRPSTIRSRVGRSARKE